MNEDKALPWLTIIEKMSKQKSYKPILLLSLINEIEVGNITTNRISLTSELEQRFDRFYRQINNSQAIQKAYLPFFYLSTDIWNIKWASNSDSKCPASNKGTRSNINFVQMREGLFTLLQDSTIRNSIKERLILKAEEDIKYKDVKRNPSFSPPKNLHNKLAQYFGQTLTLLKDYELQNDSFSTHFLKEKALQDFLVEKWTEIPLFQESNLEIYGGTGVGVEYNTTIAGRIDILAENKETHDLTVIELKRGASGERHLGQLLRYMGWVRSKLASNKSVSGLLIASKFPSSIKFAISELPRVNLYEYQLSINLQAVSPA